MTRGSRKREARQHSLYGLIRDSVPTDHSRQQNAEQSVRSVLERFPAMRDVLDLGCGEGNSAELFAEINPRIRWTGVDIEDSPEVRNRTRTDVNIVTFDGVNLPFEDGAFDLVYSRQVLEHVRRPEALLQNVFRVLRSRGCFVGSTSHLEPFHSLSYWNFTPYAFRVLAGEAGFIEITLRPSIDALTLIARRALGSPGFFSRWWWRESPLNRVISLALRRDVSAQNAAKLLFCGQFSFICRKP